jgi:hypothetical protein
VTGIAETLQWIWGLYDPAKWKMPTPLRDEKERKKEERVMTNSLLHPTKVFSFSRS